MISLGTDCVIKETRGAQREFAAKVTRAEGERFYVTRWTDAGGNSLAKTHESVRGALRFDDGSKIQDSEEYVITRITGTPPDVAKAMQEATREVQGLRRELSEAKAEMLRRDAVAHKRLENVLTTICQFLQPEQEEALMISFRKNVTVEGPPAPMEPAPKPKQGVLTTQK